MEGAAMLLAALVVLALNLAVSAFSPAHGSVAGGARRRRTTSFFRAHGNAVSPREAGKNCLSLY